MQYNCSSDLVRASSFVLFGILFALAGALAQSDVGTIDHVRVLVRDIKAAQDVYGDTLGFNLFGPEPDVFPEGSVHNGTGRLSDDSYLELMGVVNEQKLLQVRPWFVNFLRRHEGAHSVGLQVPSAKQVSDRLQSRGIEAPIFSLVSTRPGSKPFLLVTPKMAHLLGGSVFFCEYPQETLARRQAEAPNTPANAVHGIDAVWIVVKDLRDAVRDAETLGFRRMRPLESKILSAQGEEFETAHGKIILLRANTRDGPAAQFVRDRGEGVMGVTLDAIDIAKAHRLIEKNGCLAN
jgi:catechol 2,3-dioxygenase-like lactoylglutathione lyase family enzyme